MPRSLPVWVKKLLPSIFMPQWRLTPLEISPGQEHRWALLQAFHKIGKCGEPLVMRGPKKLALIRCTGARTMNWEGRLGMRSLHPLRDALCTVRLKETSSAGSPTVVTLLQQYVCSMLCTQRPWDMLPIHNIYFTCSDFKGELSVCSSRFCRNLR